MTYPINNQKNEPIQTIETRLNLVRQFWHDYISTIIQYIDKYKTHSQVLVLHSKVYDSDMRLVTK